MFDAVHVVVSAVRELNRSQEIGVKPLACTSANIWPHGTSLMNYLRMVSQGQGRVQGWAVTTSGGGTHCVHSAALCPVPSLHCCLPLRPGFLFTLVSPLFTLAALCCLVCMLSLGLVPCLFLCAIYLCFLVCCLFYDSEPSCSFFSVPSTLVSMPFSECLVPSGLFCPSLGLVTPPSAPPPALLGRV